MDKTDIKVGIIKFIRYSLQRLTENPNAIKAIVLIVTFLSSLLFAQSITHQIAVSDSIAPHDSVTAQPEYGRSVADSPKISDTINIVVERVDGTIEKIV